MPSTINHTITRRDGAWWVDGFECGPMGPYATKAEAEDDAKGVRNFYRREWKGVQKTLISKAGLPGQQTLFEV